MKPTSITNQPIMHLIFSISGITHNDSYTAHKSWLLKLGSMPMVLLAALYLCSGNVLCDETKPFTLSIRKEALLCMSGAGLSLLGNHSINRSPSPDLLKADPAHIPSIDRFARIYYSPSASAMSDRTEMPAIMLPILTPLVSLLFSQHGSWYYLISNCIFFAETSLMVNGTTALAKGSFKRYRPYVYNSSVPMEMRTRQQASQSMWSGHAVNTFSGAVFAGYTFQKFYPGSPWIKPVWGIGLSCATATAVLRVRAGQHFPTDVITGAAVGSFFGWFIPLLHLEKHPALIFSGKAGRSPYLMITRLF